MRKRINDFLNALIGISFGILVGHSVYIIYDYKAHPGLYEMQSAPWYTSIQMYGIFCAVVVGIAVIAKIIIRKSLDDSREYCRYTIFNKDFFTLENDSVRLELIDTYAGNDKELPFYWWNIISKSRNVNVGKISFRIGHNYHSYYNGNIGYEVDEEYRGNHYALLACQLMPDVARYYGMDKLYLTCDFDNVASYKTIEKLGARLIEEVQPPKDYVFYYEGMPKQRIYELKI